MLASIYPLSLVRFSVGPNINTYALRFPIHKVTLIFRTVAESLITFAMLEIVLPDALINSSIIIYHHTVAMSFAIEKLPVIHALFVSFAFTHC